MLGLAAGELGPCWGFGWGLMPLLIMKVGVIMRKNIRGCKDQARIEIRRLKEPGRSVLNC